MQVFGENLAKPYILCTGVSLKKVQISISNTNWKEQIHDTVVKRLPQNWGMVEKNIIK